MGGDGKDSLYGNTGNDQMYGGLGDDRLEGGTGNDTYYFNLGDGIDTIYNYDNTEGRLDKLIFGVGIAPDDIMVKRKEKDLELSIGDTTDKVILKNYYSSSSGEAALVSDCILNEIHFADGTVWQGTESLVSNLNTTTDDDDTFYGTDADETVHGCNGDDELYGNGGNDTLFGDAGNDTLYGGNGNDALYGGIGNDYLKGGNGNDTYYFNLGDGTDVINNYDTTTGHLDKLMFGEGISPDDIVIERKGSNLFLSINGTTDKICLRDYLDYDEETLTPDTQFVLSEICFADGTVWTGSDVFYDKLRNVTSGGDTIFGTSDDDIIHGENGKDFISGLAGNDQLYGDVGNNSIYGGAGNDQLYGGLGNDYLEGGTGNDTYYFNLGDGVDTIYNNDDTAGRLDKLVFGEGISPEDVAVSVVGTNRRDLELSIDNKTFLEDDKIIIKDFWQFENSNMEPLGCLNEICFADGTVWKGAEALIKMLNTGTPGANIIYGTTGDDVIHGGAGNDYIDGIAGKDKLYGDDGDDELHGGGELYGGDGNDKLYGDNWTSKLYGGSGNDELYGSKVGQNEFNGGAGNDYLESLGGYNTFYYNLGDDVDTINPKKGNYPSKLIFGKGISAANLQIERAGRDLQLCINDADKVVLKNYFTGSDSSATVSSNYGLHQISFWDGTLWLVKDLSAQLDGATSGEDNLEGTAGNDVLHGGDSNDILSGADGDDQLYGDSGDDSLYGGNGNDNLYGGSGDDTLYGDTGDDALYGGDGSDFLSGGKGNDTYYFNLGDGIDTINNYDGAEDRLDQLVFGEGITQEDIIVKRAVYDLELHINGTADKVILKNYFYDKTSASEVDLTYALNKICFADGTCWNGTAELLSRFDVAISGADNITGTDGDDVLHGGDSDDIVNGAAGNDQLYGDDGNDILHGGDGNDSLWGGEGNDSLYGEEGNDTLYGDNGDDKLYGNAGDDALSGGKGNDYLEVGTGTDTYYFNLGDGVDTINNYEQALNRQDKLVFGEGILPENVTGKKVDKDLIIMIAGTADSIILKNFYQVSSSAEGHPYYELGQICFADGIVWNSMWPLIEKMNTATAGDDTMYGTAEDDILHGGDGNDSLYGADGDDQLYGEAGDDYINGGSGNDILYGGTGGDTLEGQAGDDQLYGEDGNDNLAGGTGNDTLYGGNNNDSLSGGGGNDMLYGGVGDDHLEGGTGNDTYYFNLGDGIDTIDNYDTSANHVDKLMFGEGISAADIYIKREEQNLVLSFQGRSDKVILANYFTEDMLTTTLQPNYLLSEIAFADGTVWTGTDTLLEKMNTPGAGNDTLLGTEGDDIIYGGDGDDEIHGNAGNDQLYGDAGNDTLYGDDGDDALYGGIGNDTLYGGEGNNTYYYNLGDGIDTIYDSSGNGTLVFGEGITPEDIVVKVPMYDYDTIYSAKLELCIKGTSDKVIVGSYLAFNYYEPFELYMDLSEICFADGTTWSGADFLLEKMNTPTADDNTLFGTRDADVIYGGAGDDIINGNDGDDHIYGGPGNDYLLGNGGNDTFYFNLGDGVDTIDNTFEGSAMENECLIFGEGISPDDITVRKDEYDMVLSIAGTTDKVIFKWCFDTYPVDEWELGVTYNGRGCNDIYFADGTVWNYKDLTDRMNIATDEADFILGDDRDNEFHGGAGDDIIDGFWGDDTLYGDDGNDTLYGEVYDDALFGGNGEDTLWGGSGYDTLYGGDGNDILHGNDEDDILYGEAGNDNLDAGLGNDQLYGGTGNDFLAGGSGNDTYYFNLGDGIDTIDNFDADSGRLDKLVFGEGITPDDIIVTRTDCNLELIINDTMDKVILEDYYKSTSSSASLQPNYMLNEIHFEDGTVWSGVQPLLDKLNAPAANQLLEEQPLPQDPITEPLPTDPGTKPLPTDPGTDDPNGLLPKEDLLVPNQIAAMAGGQQGFAMLPQVLLLNQTMAGFSLDNGMLLNSNLNMLYNAPNSTEANQIWLAGSKIG